MATIRRRNVLGFVVSLILLAGCFLLVQDVSAQSSLPTIVSGGLEATGNQAGYANAETDIFRIIGQIISIVLGLLGLVTFIIVLYAGFIWMTAGGNGDKVKKAQGMMTSAVIGLVIILSAYALTTFVTAQLSSAVISPSASGGP